MSQAIDINKPTKAGFVRQQPVELSVEEVIERGRIQWHLDIKPHDVHAARYYMKQEAEAKLVKLEPRSVKKSTPPPSENSEESVPRLRRVSAGALQAPITKKTAERFQVDPETVFRQLVIKLGTERAKKIVDQIERESS